jgi:hypothetical protein
VLKPDIGAVRIQPFDLITVRILMNGINPDERVPSLRFDGLHVNHMP